MDLKVMIMLFIFKKLNEFKNKFCESM